MNIKDAYIGQSVGFTHDGARYIGIIKGLDTTTGVATVEFPDVDDSEINVRRLIGLAEPMAQEECPFRVIGKGALEGVEFQPIPESDLAYDPDRVIVKVDGEVMGSGDV